MDRDPERRLPDGPPGGARLIRRGIVLAGGAGTRLYPLTRALSKQLLPVYDKPMIHYPLATLMLAGIRDVLIVTTPRDEERFSLLLGDGSQWGISLQYAVQPRPEGIAQAFLIGSEFVRSEPVALILGDNLFHGHGLSDLLHDAASRETGATVFAYRVRDPERYGVVDFEADGRATDIQEKPDQPASSWAVTGLYFYDGRVTDVAAGLEPSERGELEITDVNRWYLEREELRVQRLGRGYAWLDTGTQDALLQAANFIQTIEARQDLKICCLEEVAYRMGFIGADQVLEQAEKLESSGYGDYLRRLVEAEPRHYPTGR